MARNMYGATSADFTLTAGGQVMAGAVLTAWTARTGGTQVTDLLDADSVACTTVTSGADGSVVFYGPNNEKSTLWLDSGQGSRIAVRPVDIGGDLANLDIGTVTTGSPAAAHIDGNFEDGYTLDLVLPSVGAGSIQDEDVNDAADIDRSKIAGTALTQASTGVFSVLDYGADPTGVADSSDAFQAAIDAFTGDESLAGGTVLVPQGSYIINTPLVVDKPGVHITSPGGYTAYLIAGSGLAGGTLLTYANDGHVVRGVQISNLAIEMLGVAADAVEIRGAFDSNRLSDLWINGVHKDHTGLRFAPAVTAVTDVSQTIIVDNVVIMRVAGATSVTAPLWEFQSVHEAHLRGCKAIGAGQADGGVGYLVRGHSQLVKFDTCSASTTGTGWDIRSDSEVDYSDRIVIDSPLFENVETGVLIVGESDSKAYRVALRSPRYTGTGLNYVVDATHASLGLFETSNLPVILRTGTTQCRVFSDDATQVTNSGDVGNIIIGYPNAADYGYHVGPYVVVGTSFVTASATALSLGVNRSGGPAWPGVEAVLVGAENSGGAGYRALVVPNT